MYLGQSPSGWPNVTVGVWALPGLSCFGPDTKSIYIQCFNFKQDIHGFGKSADYDSLRLSRSEVSMLRPAACTGGNTDSHVMAPKYTQTWYI